jgi:exosome complex RNA-binding protein Rrp42 (RNase PH superfamily)
MTSKAEKAYVLASLELGQRLDGRGMEEYRAIKIERIGESVRVWIGRTSVVGRVRIEVEDGIGRVTSRIQW